jgi:glycine/D-amino acid oxidase-like deaminating enzyme
LSPSKITSLKDIKGATSVPAVSFWRYKFVTSLLEIVVNRGALLYTETPVKTAEAEQDDGGAPTVLCTPRGSTRAAKVIFATNGYTSALLPQFKDVISRTKVRTDTSSRRQHAITIRISSTPTTSTTPTALPTISIRAWTALLYSEAGRATTATMKMHGSTLLTMLL